MAPETSAGRTAPTTGPGSLYYRLDGAGARVVLLHPVGLDHTFFDALVEHLADRYQVLRPDFPGHGATPVPDRPHSLYNYAADVHALLERLHYAPTAVVGFSFGGMIAQILAHEFPGDVSALVISAAASTFSDQVREVIEERGNLAERSGMAALVDSTLERWFSEEFRRRGGDEAARQRLLTDDVRGWAQAWRAIARLDTEPLLSSITVPTLCLAGELDRAVAPARLEEIAARVPAARFVIVAGAPHMLFLEQPLTVAAVLTDFLDQVL